MTFTISFYTCRRHCFR